MIGMIWYALCKCCFDKTHRRLWMNGNDVDDDEFDFDASVTIKNL